MYKLWYAYNLRMLVMRFEVFIFLFKWPGAAEPQGTPTNRYNTT